VKDDKRRMFSSDALIRELNRGSETSATGKVHFVATSEQSRISCSVSRRGPLRRAARSSSREVIYWRTIWPRVVIGTTHLRAAKWPLPDFSSRKRDNKFRFAARAAPSAFNLTGRNLVSDKRRGRDENDREKYGRSVSFSL